MPKTLTDIRSLARTHTDSMVRVLASIAISKKAPPSARVSAAEALINRGWGKPSQPVTGADGEGDIRITIRNIVEEVSRKEVKDENKT